MRTIAQGAAASLIVLGMSGCGQQQGAAEPTTTAAPTPQYTRADVSGVQGQVLATTRTGPNEYFSSPEPELVSVDIELLDAQTMAVLRTLESDAGGSFSTDLPPGEYLARVVNLRLPTSALASSTGRSHTWRCCSSSP